MSDIVITWFESLTMEEVFVITGIGILLIGAGLAFLGEWIFRKEHERNGEDG
jgi:high-affinity Fe2+/Pb2+ permease